MSISPVGRADAVQTTDSSAQAQLERDERKLAADLKAAASQAQIAADNAAILNDELIIAQQATSGLDGYLCAGAR